MQKYGFGPSNNQDALVAAQAAERQKLGNLLMLHGADQIASALGRGRAPVNEEFFKMAQGNATLPVQQILQQRQGLQQGMQNEAQVSQMASAQQAADPSSPYSKLVQKNYAGLMTRMGMAPEGIQGMSAQQIEEGLQNPLKLKASYDEVMAKMQEAAQMKQLMMQQQMEQRNFQHQQAAQQRPE